MYKLVLNAGDYVRNINEASRRYRCRGVVARVSENMYHVEYDGGIKASYHKKTAHKYLEKVVEVNNQCKCIHDEVCDKCARQVVKAFTFAQRYGSMYGAGNKTLAEAAWKTLQFERSNGRRTTLKKERRNVITGKTQSEMIKQYGTALGVTQFNTRALGKSTGQAMVKIGEAMMHPNVPVRIMDVDHAITEHGTPRRVANNHFADTIEDIIRKQELKGLHILNGEELLYLPIVTEETYVNI
ncbi:hypothetical protein ACG-C91_0015 [Escherichia phage vB_EcoP_ACG-C91]|uniref:Uncharacterized protein n=1 Tax=Escherichia phage vB_EcoP_ACG-C91 TaxID=1141139 RepID=K4FJ87_9CAUD|nr:hypothetical protein D860_gp40 [Escherichia phage vB_EcoP_ACG-C91]AFH19840.1 hypothetical protein ACG-C91_0015 [Escherichia phage vB_EcoP_ACG-C91]